MLHKLLWHDVHTCPPWLLYTFDNPLRPLIHNPARILGGFVRPGQTVLDIGCGGGYFTIGLAQLVGPQGRVIAADLQPEMLSRLRKRVAALGLLDRIQIHTCAADRIGWNEPLDFALAFWMVHEAQDRRALLAEVRSLLKPEGRLLIVEPKIHVTAENFARTLAAAKEVGLRCVAEPAVNLSRAVLLAP